MKVLSLLFSLLLGAAVLLFFLQPWDRIEKMLGDSVTRETAPPESTAAVEAAPPKPAETAAPRPMAAVAPNTPPATAPADSRTHMLANEKAEAERSAALQEKAATPAPRETKRYFKVKVLDAGTLEAGPPTEAVVIRLEGIDTYEADETCKTKSGDTWPCGAKARAALTLFIRSRAVTCTVQRHGPGPLHLARAPWLGNAAREQRSGACQGARRGQDREARTLAGGVAAHCDVYVINRG